MLKGANESKQTSEKQRDKALDESNIMHQRSHAKTQKILDKYLSGKSSQLMKQNIETPIQGWQQAGCEWVSLSHTHP